jgi:hypothetical protein
LKPKERKEVLIWLQNLKFPGGYVVGFRRAVNLDSGKLSGVKSHDYHIFMERDYREGGERDTCAYM